MTTQTLTAIADSTAKKINALAAQNEALLSEGRLSQIIVEAIDAASEHPAQFDRLSGEYEALLSECRNLTDQVDLNRDEFLRIKVICANHSENHFVSEIEGICDRSEKTILQKVPVIHQRNELEKKLRAALRTIDELNEAAIDDLV